MRKILCLLLFCNLALAQGFNAYQATTFSVTGQGSALKENTTIGYHKLAWTTSGSVSSCSVQIDSSADGSSWSLAAILTSQTCTSNGNSTVVTGSANYVRVNVTALGGGGTILITYTGWVTNPSPGTGTVTNVATGTGLTGGPITTTGTVALANTAVTPNSYTNTNLTVDQQGRITAAANGSSGGGSWSSITDPSGDQTLAMGTFKTNWKANTQTFTSFYFDPANGFGYTTDAATGPGTLFTGTAPRNGIEIRNGNATNITSIFTANHTANTGFGVFQAISGTAQTAGGYFRGLANASSVAIGTGIITKTGGSTGDMMVFRGATGDSCIGNGGNCFSSHPTAQLTVEHNASLDTAFFVLSDVHKSGITVVKSNPTSLNIADSYLHLGYSEFGANTFRSICMGYAPADSLTNCPAFLTYKETSASGNTFGSVAIYGRYVTTDTAPVRRQEWNLQKASLTNNTAVSFLDIPVASNTVAAGHLVYAVEVFNGTDLQTTTGVVGYTCTNKAGTMAVNVGTATATSQVVTAGTHAATITGITGTAKCTLQVNSNSSLTPTTNVINYSVINLSSGNDISPL